MDILMEVLKWIIIWTVVTGIAYIIGKSVYALITKPNLRRYIIETLKDVKHMYYRYHV